MLPPWRRATHTVKVTPSRHRPTKRLRLNQKFIEGSLSLPHGTSPPASLSIITVDKAEKAAIHGRFLRSNTEDITNKDTT